MALVHETFQHTDSTVFPDDTVWYSLFQKHIVRNQQDLHIFYSADAHDNGAMVFPLMRQTTKTGAVFLESVQNYYSVDFRPICSTESARTLITEAIEHIVDSKNVDAVKLKPMDSDSPEAVLIKQEFKKAGWRVFQHNYHVNWTHTFRGSYEDYINSRPRRLRSTIKRKSKRLLGMPGVELAVHDGTVELAEIIAAYNTVYDRSWKANEPYPDFIPELMSTLAKRGQFRLGLLKMDKVPVAVHFWIVKEGTAYIYKLAHDSSYDKYSPGTVLMAEMIKQVMQEDSITTLDFLSGDDEYKKDWMDDHFHKVSITAYNNRSIRGSLACLIDEHIRPTGEKLKAAVNPSFTVAG